MKYEIKLDIDSKHIKPKSFAQKLVKRIRYLENIIEFKVENIEVFETRRGYHIHIAIDSTADFDAKDITFIQLLLFSDWHREIFNWLRSRADIQLPCWNVLFQIKFGKTHISFEGKTERAETLKYYIMKFLRGEDNGEKETTRSKEGSMETM